MNKKEYDNGYEAAIKALKDIINGQQNQNQQSNGGGGGQNPNPDMQSPQDAINNGPAANKRKADRNAKKNGIGGQGQRQNQQQGNGNSSGNLSAGARQQSQASDTGTTGGGMVNQETGAELAKRAGYDDPQNTKVQSDNAIGADWQSAVESAVRAGMGDGLGNTMMKIHDLHKTNHDWKGELKTIMGRALSRMREEGFWGRKKILAATGEIARGLKQAEEDLSSVIFCIDCSGSAEGILQKLVNECYTISCQRGVNEIDILPFDDGVRAHLKLKRASEIKNITMVGGGGTNTQAVFDYMEENIKKPAELVMIFTDGYCDIPERLKKIRNLVWVIYDNPSKVLDMDNENHDSKTKIISIKSEDLDK